jgi:hypothetical protein
MDDPNGSSRFSMNRKKKGALSSTHRKIGSHRFGGRATSGGVNYEVRVAAFIAVKMLGGDRCSVWDRISGADVAAITLQTPEAVDDIVVDLCPGGKPVCMGCAVHRRSSSYTRVARRP